MINIDTYLSEMANAFKDPGIDFENYTLEEEIKKYDGVEPLGHQILIRIHIPKPEVNAGLITKPHTMIHKEMEDNLFRKFVGLVIKIGPECYLDERFVKGPRCQVGDWVTFTRAFGGSFSHNDLTSITINDDDVRLKVIDPRTIGLISL
jgi:co-chaperonin GroES (HSP10)